MTEKKEKTKDTSKAEKQVDPTTVILKEEIESLNDRLLRMAAESENMRKRFDKQLSDAKEYSVTNFAKDILNVADNLDRAISFRPSEMSDEVSNIMQGVELTRQEMTNIFTKHRMKEINPSIGDKFDYNLHYAVTQVPNPEHPEGTILELVQTGYLIGERLLRPATVTVTKKPE
jgi:molecular chaperone GrpE